MRGEGRCSLVLPALLAQFPAFPLQTLPCSPAPFDFVHISDGFLQVSGLVGLDDVHSCGSGLQHHWKTKKKKEKKKGEEDEEMWMVDN